MVVVWQLAFIVSEAGLFLRYVGVVKRRGPGGARSGHALHNFGALRGCGQKKVGLKIAFLIDLWGERPIQNDGILETREFSTL